MADEEQPQPEIYEFMKLRIFKIKQAELGKRAPAHIERKQIYEYEFICDINGPSPERSAEFMHFSSYFKIQFRGDNLLKGIVPNSLRVIDPVDQEHYVTIDANLIDSQLFIQADFNLNDSKPNVSQVQIHFKIVLLDKLDLNLMRMFKAQVMHQAHCFEIYHRNGTPPTVTQIKHGVNPFEVDEDEEDMERINEMFRTQVQGTHEQVNNLNLPQIGGSSVTQPQENSVENLSDDFLRMQIQALGEHSDDEKDKPDYVSNSIMIRFEINKMPTIIAAVPPQRTVRVVLDTLKQLIFDERLHFPELDITNDTCDKLRIHYENVHVSDENQTFRQLLDANYCDDKKIQFMVLVWGDPRLNAQVTKTDARFNEQNLDNRAKVVRRFMEQMIILMRNVDACLANIKHGRSPPERIRYNHAAKKTPEDLTAKDLGKLVKEMARVVKDLGLALSQLAHVCQKDEEYAQNDNDPKLVRAKSIVQNVMDSLRYFAPAANSLSRMVVPLDDPARPRTLYVLQPQAGQAQNQRAQNQNNRPPA